MTVKGGVVDGVSGLPVAAAVVTVTGTDRNGKRLRVESESDAAGRFAATLPAGSSRVRASATRDGYRVAYAWNLGSGDFLAASVFIDPPEAGNVTIRLWPTARIVGRVTDSQGGVVVGATVEPYVATHTGLGVRWLRRPGRPARTDDHGVYAIEGLPEGRYVLVVELATQRAGEPTRFFPDTPIAQNAVPVDLSPGQLRQLDVRLFTVPTRTVAGRLTGGREYTSRSVDLYTLGIDGEPLEFSKLTASVDRASRFSFPGIPAGSYRAMVTHFPPRVEGAVYFGGDFVRTQMPIQNSPYAAWTALSDLATWVGQVQFTVDAVTSVDELAIELREGARIRGRVQFDGEPPARDTLPTVPVVVRPADGFDIGLIPEPRLEKDGTFVSSGLPPGQFVVNVLAEIGALTEWAAVKMTVSGRDVLGLPVSLGTSDVDDFTITLSKREASISGSVRDSRGGAAASCRVIVFPAEREQRRAHLAYPAPRRVAMVPVDRSGRFHVTVPPGTYRVGAVTTISSDWMSSQSLNALEGTATTVVARLGETATTSLAIR